MESIKTECIFTLVVDVLKHLESVQKEIVELSERSAVTFHTFLKDNNLHPDEKVLEVFQYQDVIAQQLGAISEIIVMLETNVNIYLEAVKNDDGSNDEGIKRLFYAIEESLVLAQQKQEAFSGNAINTSRAESIEFF